MQSRPVRLLSAVFIGFGAPLVYWAVPGGKSLGSLAETLLVAAILATATAVWLELAARRRDQTSAGDMHRGHDADHSPEGR